MTDGAPRAAMPGAIRVPGGDYMARLHWRLRARLPLWTVFGPGTIEYPAHWVARMHVVLPEARATRFVITHDSLGELRAILPPGLTHFPRHPDDVPHLVEVWL
jgi:hypothetical protein